VTATSPARLEPRLVRLALLMSLGSFAAALDITVVGVAINRLSSDLGGGIAAASWVTTAYLLALTAVLPLTGWIVARVGTRRAWIGTLAVFLVGSALCGLAWSLPALIGFRVLQGLGGGMLLPLVRIVLAEQAGPERMGRLMTFVIVPAQIAPILGPVLGGLVVGGLDWRWAFLLNVPVCVVALALSARLVPAGSPAPRTPLDVRGLLLLSTGLAALVYGLTADGVIAMVAGAVLLAGYAWHALRSRRTPVLDLRLFRDRSFTACSVLVFVFGGSLFGATFLLPLLFQNVLGTDPLTAGLLMAPQGVGAMVGTVIVGRLVDRGISARTLVLTGIALSVLGTLPFLFAGPATPVPLLVAALVVRGFGLITALLPSTTATYATLPRSDYAAATTGTRIAQQVGGSLGTAVLAAVLAGSGFGAALGVTVGITALAAVGALLLPRLTAAADAPPSSTPRTGRRS